MKLSLDTSSCFWRSASEKLSAPGLLSTAECLHSLLRLREDRLGHPQACRSLCCDGIDDEHVTVTTRRACFHMAFAHFYRNPLKSIEIH